MIRKNEIFDVAIIGAGIAGASTAYHLSRQSDLKILLLERESGFGVHASGRNAALLRQAVFEKQTATLIQETVRSFKNPPPDWNRKKIFNQTGSILLGTSPEIERLHKILSDLSVPSQTYDSEVLPESLPENLKKFLANISYPALLHTPGDGVVDVHALLANLLDASQASGTNIKYNFSVRNLFQKRNHWVLEGNTEKFLASVVVNAAGAWAMELGKQAGRGAEGMAPYRRHLYISEPSPEVSPAWPYVWNIQQECYFRPDSGGLLLCPGDEELHPPRPPETDPRILELLASKLKRHFPPLAPLGIRRSWACLRTKQGSGALKIGPEDPSGFFWVAALGGHGVSASIGVGRLAACQIFDYLNSVDKLGKLA